MNRPTMEQKMREYEAFVESVLRPDLERIVRAQNETITEIDDYRALSTTLQGLHEGNQNDEERLAAMKAITESVDLGYEKIYCRAQVADASRLFVHVGMGFHVELTIDEASKFVVKRLAYLLDHVLARKTKRVNQVRDHIQSSQLVLDELSRELGRLPVD